MLTTWGFILFILYHMSFARVPNVEPEFLTMLRETGRHEEFAKYLGINDVSLVHPMEGRSEVENLELITNVSPLGDILLTPEQEEQARQGLNFNKYSGNKWPNNCVPYTIQEKDFPTRRERNRITSALDAMNNQMKKMKFVPRTNQKDYVTIFSGSGCYSNLGRVGGQQPVSLQSGTSCTSAGTTQHEMMHALGFMHEHCRPDRDNYVNVKWENIEKEWRAQYEKANPDDFSSHGGYGYDSVMHYPMGTSNGRSAFDILDKSADTRRMGQRDGATEDDIAKINELYN